MKELQVIAHIENDFSTKFGLPRQSGIVDQIQSRIVFEQEFRSPEALRGIEEYSHLWLIWQFSENADAEWSATVRPPRLGGNKRMGVFATRSPFRPNPIGLSSVRLISVEPTESQGTVLVVAGADLMNGTPIYDIKPYIAYSDCHSDAVCGFADKVMENQLTEVVIPEKLVDILGRDRAEILKDVLIQDPRPAYQDDPQRIYGFTYAGYDIKFSVRNGVLTVTDIIKQTD